MPDSDPSEQTVLNKSQAPEPNAPILRSSSRRTSSTQLSHVSHKRSPSPSRGSKTPLTPDESPPFKQTRKRDASIVALEDKEIDRIGTPAHRRGDSGESAAHVCICQPDPKIPRPRNAFILYRQHHQANAVAQHPGLANPEISKIIGQQWRNQPAEVRNEWKALAEEEKLRHQQQYPSYRYQPKRSGRRNSVTSDSPTTANSEKPKCAKCGGRSLYALSAPFSSSSSRNSPTSIHPRTPRTAGITPVSRTLPVFRDLSLQSPATARSARQFQGSAMPPVYSPQMDERDDLGPLSPDPKRRRYNGEYPGVVQRTMPPRYIPQSSVAGPGTPFPFGHPPPPHPYPAAATRRESLPGLRGVVSPPGPMAPPPRPGMGYQQHRLSQGHVMAHDRSLILPPLQTSATVNAAAPAPPGTASRNPSRTVEDIIAGIAFNYKIKVLGRIAPPAPTSKEILRGPLIVVEGDNPVAVRKLSDWLVATLGKEEHKSIQEFEGPKTPLDVTSANAMAVYHRLAADWLDKQAELVKALTIGAKPAAQTRAISQLKAANRDVDEDYDDSSDDASSSAPKMNAASTASDVHRSSIDRMDVDPASNTTSPVAPSHSNSGPCVVVIPNFSLHASNTFASLIPINDPYSPSDHWQWTATQWRGVVGPDLTIYLKDNGDSAGKQTVEILEDERYVVVKRAASADSETGVEGSVLRRLGFEIGEWVRGFAVAKGHAEEGKA